MTESTPVTDLREPWETRAETLMRALPYAVLLISCGIAAISVSEGYPTGWGRYVAAVGLAVVTAGWTLWMSTLHPEWESRPRRMAVFYVVRWLCSAGLVVLNPWFGIYAFSGYMDAIRLFSIRRGLIGVVATAFLMALAQIGGLQKPTLSWVAIYLAVVAFNAVLASGFTLLSYHETRQSSQRKDMIVDLEEALAENAGLHAQLVAQAREAGVLDERQRLAREIHDTLAQGLTGIITQLEAADRARHEPDVWQGHLDLARALARESLTEARRSVQALHPEPLDDETRLSEALAGLTKRWAESADVPVTFEATGVERRLLAEIEATLFRVAQEALTNVRKHAHATKVGVTLSYLDDVVLLDVRDDGVGFDPRQVGFGLRGMRQRLQRVAGRLEVESTPGDGTALSASVPALPPEEEER